MPEDYVASVRGGHSITSKPPVFSANSEHVYCCSGTTIRVYSAKSGRFVRTFRGGHTDVITGVALNPRNCFQVITSGEDGNVVVWDTEGGVLKSASLGEPIADIALLTSSQQDRVFCLQKKSGDEYSLISFDLASLTLSAASPSEEKLTQGPLVKHHFTMPEPRQHRLVINKATSTVAACSGKKIYVWNCDKRQLVKLNSPYAVTCLASHPTEGCIAAGSTGGQIRVWYQFSEDAKKAESVELHWHAHAVTDIAFTHDGVYLLSGGEESVLVIWTLADNGATRNFLPRLGAPLKHIASSQSDQLTAITHTDNVVRMVSGISCTPLFAIGGLLKVFSGQQHSNRLPAGLVTHHSRSALVLNGATGMLQVYNPFADKPFFDVDIVCANYVAPSLEKVVPFPVVNHATLSDDGQWLATVEFWEREGYSREQVLKFWRFSQKAGQFRPVSHVDQSLLGRITSLKFQPSQRQLTSGLGSDEVTNENGEVMMEDEEAVDEMKAPSVLCVTSYDDGMFKCWSAVEFNTKQGVSVTWKCWSSTHHRPEPISATAFSCDGSLLAVAYKRLITLWVTEDGSLKHSLVLPHVSENVRLMTFGCDTSARFLLVATEQYLLCWDIISLNIVNTVQVSLSVLTADRHSPYIATVTRVTPAYPKVSVCVFKPGEKRTICNAMDISKHAVVSAAFVPRPRSGDGSDNDAIRRLASWRRKSELFLLSEDQRLLYLHPADEEEETFEEEEDAVDKPSILAKFIEEKSEVAKVAWPKLEAGQRHHTAHTMLTAPAHTLPAMSALCTSFLESLMLPRTEEAK